MDWIMTNGEMIIDWGAKIIAAASIIANLTPTQTDNNILNTIGKVINFLAAYWRDPDAVKK